MNSKYVSSTPVLNIGTLLFVFIVFDTGKGQFDVANYFCHCGSHLSCLISLHMELYLHSTWKDHGNLVLMTVSLKVQNSDLVMQSMRGIIQTDHHTVCIDMTAWNLMLKKVCKKIQKKYSTMDATILKELFNMH